DPRPEGQAGQGAPRGAVLGQGLLRPGRGSREAGPGRCRAGSGRTALPVPAQGTGRRAQALREGAGNRVVPGRAAEPGRLVPDPPPPDRLPAAGPGDRLCRAHALALACLRPLRRPRGRAGRARRRRTQQSARRRSRRRVTPSNRIQQQDVAMSIEVKVPVLPESVSDAVIAAWHKKAGDAVSRDENLLDLETDKVVLEVPAPVDGVLKEIKFEAGETVTSQQVIAVIEEGAAPAKSAEAPKEEKKEAPKAEAAKPAKTEAARPAAKQAGGELPPGARFTAAKEGIDPSQVPGTGRRGAVTKEDLLNYARNGGAGNAGGARPEERVPMTRMRARIAERL